MFGLRVSIGIYMINSIYCFKNLVDMILYVECYYDICLLDDGC